LRRKGPYDEKLRKVLFQDRFNRQHDDWLSCRMTRLWAQTPPLPGWVNVAKVMDVVGLVVGGFVPRDRSTSLGNHYVIGLV
jgi:hypothetical protein